MANRVATRLMLGASLALASAACIVNSTDIPSLTGPSELALSFAVTATPDTISHDGASQSVIAVTARDASGRAAAGVQFRLDMLVGGVAADYGRLSSRNTVTGSDGRATVFYTAPAPPPAGANIGRCSPSPFSPLLPGTCVTISATPVGTGFSAGTNSQTVDIHLVPLGVIAPPADTPTASFVVSPTPVQVNIPAFFDASSSCGGPLSGSGQCTSGNVIVTYSWGFGDGSSGSGRSVSHAFSAAGTYAVTLTVTNDGGRSASTTQTVSVTVSPNPTADFVFSPSAPVVGQQVQFNGSTSRAGPGRTIVRWDWNFGDGETQSGVTVRKNYLSIGAFNVTLTVTDDAGSTGTTSNTVSVGTANPTALLSILKGIGGLPCNIQADGSASTAVGPATLTTWAFNWGDGTPIESGSPQVRTHNYAATTGCGTYTVRLTVTDNAVPPRTGTVTASVTVP